MAVAKTARLYEVHKELGAKMAPCNGWSLPLYYPGGTLEEHRHTRTKCGIFDTSHLGKFQIAGINAGNLLDKMLARPVSDLSVGCCCYNLLLNEFGCVTDDLIICRMAKDDYFAVVNSENTNVYEKIFPHESNNEVTLRNLSLDLAKIDICGPLAGKVLSDLGVKIGDLPEYYHWATVQIGTMRAIISRTGYTGELGYELFFDGDYVYDLWEELINDPAVRPSGMSARESLRLEMGYPRYGHELSKELTPEESGLGRLPGLKKAVRPAERQQLGAILLERGTVQPGNVVLNDVGVVIGAVTSGGFCPSLEKIAVLASVDCNCAIAYGGKVLIDNGKNQLSATVANTPFIHSTSLHNQP